MPTVMVQRQTGPERFGIIAAAVCGLAFVVSIALSSVSADVAAAIARIGIN